MTTGRLRALALAALVACARDARADAPAPPAVAAQGLDDRLGALVDGAIVLRGADGRATRLDALAGDDAPTLLVLAYYRCPMLCGLVLRSTVQAILDAGVAPGRDFHAITVSFDPDDGPDAARAKQEATLGALGHGARAEDWPFLVGDARAIDALTRAVGFRAARDPTTGDWAHPAVVFVLTPERRVARYLSGVALDGRDLRWALAEAGGGRVGTVVGRALLTCYEFDPASRRYAPRVRLFFRAGALAVLASVLALLAVLARRGARSP